MMSPTEDQLHDVEKDASVTEGSHTQQDSDAADSHLLKSTAPPPSRQPILLAVGMLVALVLVVSLPLALMNDESKPNKTSLLTSESQNVATPQQQQQEPVVVGLFDMGPAPPQGETEPDEEPVNPDQCAGQLEGDYYEVSQIWAFDLSLGEYGLAEARTFQVEPSHTVLENGVVFNVETVLEAVPADLAKPTLTTLEVQTQIQDEASKFYQEPDATDVFKIPTAPNVTVEVVSNADVPLVYTGNQGFLAACMMAFAQHLPLALTPDHIWTVIAQGFALHVDQHAEELRDLFVDHEGKKEIVIEADAMVIGESPPEQWEEIVFPKFSEEIGKNMNNQEAYKTLSEKTFSTSTAAAQAASEIVLMATMKNYFEFTMLTSCGIPQVRLEGTRDDWVALRERSKKLAQWMLPNATTGELWITDIVLPILDQFVDAYDGKIDYCFWQNMVKFRTTGGGSGSYEFLSGWLPTLFPYLTDEEEVRANPYLRNWEESASALRKGPKPSQIPSQMSSVPVQWVYFTDEFPLHFHAGFRGVTQEADGTLSPVLGWYVTHDPNQK